MAYVDKSFSNLTGNGSDFTVGSLSGLPTIPKYATINSVWLYFNTYRKDGSINGGKVSVNINGTDYKVSDISRNTQYNNLSFNLTNYVSNSNGTLSYTHGSSISIRVYHNWWALGQADWTISGIYIRVDYTVPIYTITTGVSPTDAGTVSQSGTGYYEAGGTAVLTATAAAGYKFTQWNDGNTSLQRVLTVTGNATYTAYFEKATYTITTAASPLNGGTVSGGGTFDYGGSTTLTAYPATGYKFTQWNDGGTVNPRTVSAYADATYTAYFEKATYEVTTSVSPLGFGTVTGAGTYEHGSTATLTAVPETGYKFTQWNDGNKENPRTVTVTGGATYTANFIVENYTVTTEVSPAWTGTVTGGGDSYNHGDIITLYAEITVTGYEFTQWSDGNKENPRTVTVTGDATYTAEAVSIPKYPFYVNKNQCSGLYIDEENKTIYFLSTDNNKATTDKFDTVDGWHFDTVFRKVDLPTGVKWVEKIYINGSLIYSAKG